jgi:hypothetical protein
VLNSIPYICCYSSTTRSPKPEPQQPLPLIGNSSAAENAHPLALYGAWVDHLCACESGGMTSPAYRSLAEWIS